MLNNKCIKKFQSGTAYVTPQQLPVQTNPGYNQQMQAGSPIAYPGGNAMPSTAIASPQSVSSSIPGGNDDIPPKYD